MEMIRHDDELVDEVGFRMLLKNFRENDISHGIVFENAFAPALIEPCLDFQRKQPMILILNFLAPWLWILIHPHRAIFLPFL